jgi:hypothetical protein
LEKSSIYKNARKSLLVVLISVLFLNTFTTNANAAETNVAPDPLSMQINQIGENATVTVKVTNVTDLFTWQIRLYFNSTILNCTSESAWLPTSHVFDNKTIVPVAAVVDSDENGTYIDYGCTLILGEDPFTGNGTLCQINFTGTAEGSSALSFGPWPSTIFLLDQDGTDITFGVTDGEIIVIPEFPTLALLSLLMILTLVATIIADRRMSNKHYASP